MSNSMIDSATQTPEREANWEADIDHADIYGRNKQDALKIEAQLNALSADTDPADVIQTVVDRMTDLQRAINKYTERAEQDISQKATYLAYLEKVWTPYFLQHGPELLTKEGQVTLKCGSAGILRFEKTGGWVVKDRDELMKELNEQWGEDELAEIGASRVVRFTDKNKPYKYLFAYCEKLVKEEEARVARALQVLGEVQEPAPEFPAGIVYVPEKKHGKCRVGSTKPWSVRTLLQGFKKCVMGAGTIDEDEE